MTVVDNAELRRMTRDLVGLPMPRDKDLTLGLVPRPRVRQERGPRFPFPIPSGWFIVAATGDVAPGEVVPLHYFARDLVLYRTEAGLPRVVEAYCAHLGAHLAVGGKVAGDCVVCPFHGWRYDGATGKCTDIPYNDSDHVPSQAKVDVFATIERNGMIWVWHSVTGRAPFYEVPVLAEFDDEDWSDPLLTEFHIATSCQDMAENNHDFAHFKFVHGTDDIPWGEHVVDGPYKRSTLGGDGGLTRETFGLGLGVVRTGGAFVFLSSTTPIDEDNVHVRWIFSTPVANGPEALESISSTFLAGLSQDIPIWENKAFKERPVLTKEETGILTHREWAQQFYD